MIVLRISDYIQIHSARAPGQLLHLKSLSSPVSRGEWSKHASVREINQAHEDPESIFVDCEPESAATFVSMQRLLRDIQRELDQCWAVMGEVYGRFAPLSSLGITVRRIRSNIDNPADFQARRSPSYIPKEIKFTTASAELMDLLIAPLYGQRPEIGIRELMQNSVDACLERDDMLQRNLISLPTPPAHDVIVTLTMNDGKSATLSIEDFGVGMTVEVVEKYFLNIGASFRSSDAWRSNHEIAGHATIHRTGRFGIGVLAAFLLGNQIRVTTRHISLAENMGIEFACSQGSEAIEIKPCNFHHGTKLEIDIQDDIAKKLTGNDRAWDWYCLEKPKVQRQLIENSSKRLLTQERTVPGCEADLSPTKWRRITAEGYDDVMWSYEADVSRYRTLGIICNGIFVTHSIYRQIPKISPKLNIISASSPALVVFDQDGRFPLNLQRNEISTSEFEFHRALGLDISNHFSRGIIEKFEPLKAGANTESIQLSLDPQIAGLSGREGSSVRIGKLILLRNGILPADYDLIQEVKPNSILIDATNLGLDQGAYKSKLIQQFYDAYIAVDPISHTKVSRSDFLSNSLGGLNYEKKPTGFFKSLPIVGRRILIRMSDIKEIVSPGNVTRSQWNQAKLEQDYGTWGLWSIGSLPTISLDIAAVCAELDKAKSFGITIFYFDWTTTKKLDDPGEQISSFAEAWKQAVRSPVLPQRLE